MNELTDAQRRDLANQILENQFWQELLRDTRIQCIGGWLASPDPKQGEAERLTILTLQNLDRAVREAAGLDEEERPAANG